MQVKITEDFVFVKTPYNHKDFVRDILNGVWSKREGMYRFPKNIHAMRELMRYYPELKENDVFVSTGKKIAEVRNRFLELKSIQNMSGNPRLRPYQNADVHYLQKLPHAGVFNQQRTGKTPICIELMKRKGTRHNLVIAPASLIWNWAEEFKKWDEGMLVYVASGMPVKRQRIYDDYWYFSQKRKVLIISKDTWKSDLKSFRGYAFDTCFVDEAHYLRNYKTQQSQAIFSVEAKHRYALTGTPAVKHGKDIFGILHFLYPERFPSYWQFVERYWGTYQDDYGTKINPEPKPERKEELEELIGFMSVQRLRKDVMQWLPDKEYIRFHVEMDKKQRKLYDQMVDTFMASDPDTDISIDTSNVLSQLMRMRQLCLDPALLGFDAPSAKTQAILEWLENNQEPVVIMSMFTSYLHRLKPEIEAMGLKVGMVHGEMSNSDKHRTATEFQAGRLDVLLCNIISAGTGFTLDRAEAVIFTDKAWNPAENEQAEDRITPTVQERVHKHSIITLACTNSYDSSLERLLEDKVSLTDIVQNGGREAIKNLLRGV